MYASDPVEVLVRRARRRYFFAATLEWCAWGAGSALAALLVVLLACTYLLDWYWLMAAGVLGLAVSAWRLAKGFPTLYQAAQLVDRNLGAEDAISTAYYFSRIAPQARADPAWKEAQHWKANELARTADIQRALPVRLPGALYAAMTLALAAGILFAWRYRVVHGLDLRPPVVNLAFDTFAATPTQQSSPLKTPAQRIIDEQLEQMGIPAGKPPAPAPEAENLAQAAPVDGPDRPASGEQAENGGQKVDAPGERSNGGDSQDNAAQDQAPTGSPPGARQAANREDSPLLDKLRDAMANLLAKLKIKPPPGLSTHASASQTGKPSRHATRSEKSGPGPGEQAAEGAERAQAEGNQAGEGEQPANAAQGSSPAGTRRQASTQDGKSGIGRQDGDKRLREAEQLQAMGKLREILGRRATETRGEMMVEVKSGKQDLNTPYSQRTATHADAGGEIHRHEVPLLYQHYVEQYFEQVHKPAPKP